MFLYGASGHAKVIIDCILSSSEHKIEAIYDDYPKEKKLLDIPIRNDISNIEKNSIFIISIGNNKVRKKIAEALSVKFKTVIHRTSTIAQTQVKIGEGTVVMANATINPYSTIGKHCIINSACVVEHDCIIEDYVHISPNAALAGNVVVGEGTQIGLGANVIPGVKIGKWCVIGAGATVIDDVPDLSVVVGSPARFIKFNK